MSAPPSAPAAASTSESVGLTSPTSAAPGSSSGGGSTLAPRPFALASSYSTTVGRATSPAAVGPSPTAPAVSAASGSANKLRASVDSLSWRQNAGPHTAGPSLAASPAAAAAAAASAASAKRGSSPAGQGLRPASEYLAESQRGQPHRRGHSVGATAADAQPSNAVETIDRWFEDMQHYETTLEEMAAASLDSNFKEELTAIEQWFRVLSEAERTAALYSLLQSATPLQMRFFITVLQQMARQDPAASALLTPANPSQPSFESQMDRFGSLSLNKSPSSSLARSYARQSFAGPPNHGSDSLFPPDLSAAAASTLAAQRAKLKASSRLSAPPDLLDASRGHGGGTTLGESLKSPLWSREETLPEQRTPSPRPPPNAPGGGGGENGSQQQQFLRSPIPDVSSSFADQQLSPAIGGSWASMVNTPLVPMFATNKGGADAADFGTSVGPGGAGGASNVNLDSVGQRLSTWNGNASTNSNGGIVLDDARKFRRSARTAGGTNPPIRGGALGGMYDENTAPGSMVHDQRANSAATAQRRVQEQIQAMQQLKGAPGQPHGGMPSGPPASSGGGGNNGLGGSRMSSSGALSSPGLQQTAMAAQQNWRNANAAHLPPPPPQQDAHQPHQSSLHQGPYGAGPNFGQQQQPPQPGFGGAGGLAPSTPNVGLGVGGIGMSGGPGAGNISPASPSVQAQLASLLALQQQVMQQQQQLQNLASMQGLGVGKIAGLGGTGGVGPMGLNGPAGGPGLSPGLAGPQISPRLGGSPNGFGVGGGAPAPGLAGGFAMPSPHSRRSPRPYERSPGGNFSSGFGSSRPGGGGHPSHSHGHGHNHGHGVNTPGSANPQQIPGSGANPDEPLDMNLLADTPQWLRSLRLHKYTSNFEGVSWEDMIKMGDKDLEDKGVAALGARRKLLKVFETVRAKTGRALPGDSAGGTSPLSPSSDTFDSPLVDTSPNPDHVAANGGSASNSEAPQSPTESKLAAESESSASAPASA
ncbi:hypothetical protein JCM8202_001252 [Rhodotorula sphaerocarpa]